MKVTITITCDNEAFTDYPAGELSRILTEYARRVRDRELVDLDRDRLMDANGNTVGEVRVRK
jgi:hypothetical protein